MRKIPDKCNQRGVSLILAIFILVLLSLLGAAMINILSSGSESVAREVISTRALFSAESGAQRKLTEVFPPGAATDLSNCDPSINYSYSFGGINECAAPQATVRCVPVSINSVNYVTVTSTGFCGPAGSQAVRVVEIQARDGL